MLKPRNTVLAYQVNMRNKNYNKSDIVTEEKLQSWQ
jgi:hypothetical protein